MREEKTCQFFFPVRFFDIGGKFENQNIFIFQVARISKIDSLFVSNVIVHISTYSTYMQIYRCTITFVLKIEKSKVKTKCDVNKVTL